MTKTEREEWIEKLREKYPLENHEELFQQFVLVNDALREADKKIRDLQKKCDTITEELDGLIKEHGLDDTGGGYLGFGM